MATEQSDTAKDGGRVLRFRHRTSAELRDGRPSGTGTQSPDDLAQYAQRGERDDYRHRMITNAIAFAFIVFLIGAGLWLADTMAQMRKNQDCVLSGRRGCTPVDVPRDRW